MHAPKGRRDYYSSSDSYRDSGSRDERHDDKRDIFDRSDREREDRQDRSDRSSTRDQRCEDRWLGENRRELPYALPPLVPLDELDGIQFADRGSDRGSVSASRDSSRDIRQRNSSQSQRDSQRENRVIPTKRPLELVLKTQKPASKVRSVQGGNKGDRTKKQKR